MYRVNRLLLLYNVRANLQSLMYIGIINYIEPIDRFLDDEKLINFYYVITLFTYFIQMYLPPTLKKHINRLPN